MENTKRLFRSRKEKLIGGLCGGIAEYFNIDPVIIRLIWVALMFIGGWAVLAYIIGWIIVPIEPVVKATKTEKDCCKDDSSCCKEEETETAQTKREDVSE